MVFIIINMISGWLTPMVQIVSLFIIYFINEVSYSCLDSVMFTQMESCLSLWRMEDLVSKIREASLY